MRTENSVAHARRLAALLVLCAGCGVREYLHEQAPIDTSDDFGPSALAGQRSIPIVQPPAAGTAAIAPAAGIGVAPVAGIGAGRMSTNPFVPPPVSGSAAPAGRSGSTVPPPVAGMTAPAPAPSGVTLDIGGKAVAKEDAIAFIHFGHSNMAGRAETPTAARPYFLSETDPHAWMYHAGKPLEPALEPFTAGDESSGRYAGPGTALLKQAVAMAPSKYFISLGFGKSSAYCSQFLPGSLYYDTVMKAALAIKDRVTFGAIVILLGITERHGTSADITGYSSCINKLVTAIRRDIGRPDLPLLICDYEQEATGSLAITSSFAQSVLPEIRKIPSVVTNSAIVPTDKLGMQDDHHFNLDGHKEYTRRVLQIMKDKGWFPWAN